MHVALYSQVSSVVKFNGSNYSYWFEHIQFHLGVLNLDLVLLTERSAVITNESSAEKKSFHKTRERSNRLIKPNVYVYDSFFFFFGIR